MSGSARGGAEHLARIHGTEEDKVRRGFKCGILSSECGYFGALSWAKFLERKMLVVGSYSPRRV